jgi:hypothetical protein
MARSVRWSLRLIQPSAGWAYNRRRRTIRLNGSARLSWQPLLALLHFAFSAERVSLMAAFDRLDRVLAAGLTISAAAALVDAYRRRGRLDLSRAAVDAKTRSARAGTTAAIAIGLVAASILSRFGGSSVPLLGFVVGIFAFLALLLSPLFAPRRAAQPPTSPLSRMTSMERRARRNF